MHDDPAGPTAERLAKARGYFTVAGRSRSARRIVMMDDALGRAWLRQKISAEEYAGLRRYALHWLAGGLAAHLGSVDLNRILAHDPASMSGLCKTEKQAIHRDSYHAARREIGLRPAYVADSVACFDVRLVEVGKLLGYRSEAHAREAAASVLSDAGYRLAQFWKEHDKEHDR
jgi:hypothetical protein